MEPKKHTIKEKPRWTLWRVVHNVNKCNTLTIKREIKINHSLHTYMKLYKIVEDLKMVNCILSNISRGNTKLSQKYLLYSLGRHFGTLCRCTDCGQKKITFQIKLKVES